jgi:hypothetical protein
MGGSGFVYGRFFSNGCGSAGYSLEDAPPRASGIPSNRQPAETEMRLKAGHRHVCLRYQETPIAFFWVGYGGSCNFRGTARPLPQGAPFIYDISAEAPGKDSPLDSGILNPLLLCLQDYLGEEARGRLLVCTPIPFANADAAACSLYRIASYDSIAPHLRCSPVVRPKSIPEKAVDAIRARSPAIIRAASRALSSTHLRKYLMEGKLAGAPLRISFNGSRSMACYYSGVIFSRSRSNVRRHALQFPFGRLQADMEASWLVQPVKNSDFDAVLPALCRTILLVGASFDQFVGSLPKSASSDIKKIISSGFESATSEDFFDFLLFYHSMYLPMLGARHREHSLYLSFDALADFFSAGFILFVKQGRNPVAGMVSMVQGGTLLGKTMGIAAGSAAHTRAGANSAVVYYLIKYAYENRLAAVDFGYSSPFASDGVLKFKAKWGGRLVADRNSDLLCLNFRDEETKKRFFSACLPLELDSLEAYEPAGPSPSVSQTQGRQKAG